MTPAMDPCPSAPKKARGAHRISVLVPDKPKHPATLFCDRCGMTKAVRLDFPRPADDLVDEAVRLTTRTT
jgi:hypothetical protein